MSGHSKWHSIKHKKAATDAAKSKVLNKHSKILSVIGRDDPNPETNASLRVAIANAKADSVPNDNIDRILKKLSGADKNAAQFTEQVYEGFGPDGIPFIVKALTDNNNRTFPEVRTLFEKNGGKLGSQGSVSFLFDHVGVLIVKTAGRSEDELFELLADAGVEDFDYDTDETECITEFAQLASVRDQLEGQGIEVIKSEPEYRPKDPKMVTDQALLDKLTTFEEKIETCDDVTDIFHGYDVDDALLTN